MEIAHILEDLAYDMGTLPRDAIESAVIKREQITPYLLEILKDATHRIDEVIEDDNYQGHVYALYLLAQFREQAAFPLILELFSYPGEIPNLAVGDVVTEDLSRILASVCGGDITPLKRFIESPLYSEYVRAACQSALVTLVGCGELSRKDVIEYFRHVFEVLEMRPSFVWDNLISCCCDLYPEELYPQIQQAFQLNLIDPSFISLEEVAQILTQRKQSHLLRLHQAAELIEDTALEIEKWLVTTEYILPSA
jgi:hypothetical protein